MESLTIHPIFSILDTADNCIYSQNKEFKTAFESFRNKLIKLNEKEKGVFQIYRQIREVEAKITFIQNKYAKTTDYEKSRILDRLLTIVTIEKELVNMRLAYPESFEIKGKKAGAELKSKLKWSGSQCDLIELIIAIINSQVISTVDGKPLTQVYLIAMFEKFFNIQIKYPHFLKSEIYRRKKASTPFIDRLRENVLKQITNYYEK